MTVTSMSSISLGSSISGIPIYLKMNKTTLIIFSLLFTVFSCKESTKPANCNPGYSPCSDNENLCCADTTSHSFVWEIDTLGIGAWGNMTQLMDVSIISDNDIWVSGSIPFEPGNNERANCAHWNGTEWELIEVTQGQDGYSPTTFYTIYAADDNHVWAQGPYFYNGTDWSFLSDGPYNTWDSDGLIYDIWGWGPDNMYFSGGTSYEAGIGTVVHWDGSTFTKINPGTHSVLWNITGTDGHVFVSGIEAHTNNSVLYDYSEGSWNLLFESTIYTGDISINDLGYLRTIMCIDDTLYATSINYLVKMNVSSHEYTYSSGNDINSGYHPYTSISGNSPSDIMLFGQGIYLHYNGIDWYRDETLYQTYSGIHFGINAGQLKGDTAVFVGYMGDYAIAIRGHRVN